MATSELILFLLMIAAALELLAQRTGIPRPIVLVLAGAVLAMIPGLPRVAASPDVIFFIFIPPLLYWAALTTSFRDFRRNLAPISLLAVGLVAVTAAAVAAVAHAVAPTLTWPAAFALGAAVSPTDAVAATAVMRRLRVPRRLVSVLEGESLVNDATAVVVFQMAVVASAAGAFTLGGAVLRFVWTAAGGVAVGLAAGWVVVRIRRWLERAEEVDVLVESTLSVLAPYAAFLPADRLGVSGVLAVVVLGMYVGRETPRFAAPRPRLQANQIWQMLNFVLEGLIFILVGLGLPLALATLADYSAGMLAMDAALVSVAVIAVRLGGVVAIAVSPRAIGRRLFGRSGRHPPWREVAFAGWAGLRGGMSLVVALSVPLTTASGARFPGRSLVISLTFAVILVTLVGQGLTLAPVIRWLRIPRDTSGADEEARSRLAAARAGIARLDQIVAEVEAGRPGAGTARQPDLPADEQLVRSVAVILRERETHRAHRYAARAAMVARDDGGAEDVAEGADEALEDARRTRVYRRLRLAMLGAERRELIRLRDTSEIGDGVLHRVLHDLDLEQTLLEADDASPARAR